MTEERANAESSVRDYLMWLENPESLRDEAAIAEARRAVDAATDPIDRLKAISNLKRTEQVDGSHLRSAFLAHARSWAGANDVTVDAFREIGVPAQDLRDAGFSVPGRSSGPASAAKGGTRRRRVSPEAIRSAVPPRAFRIADLEAASGASTATVRKVVSEMVAAGEIVDLGPDPDHQGRGRAPSVYRPA